MRIERFREAVAGAIGNGRMSLDKEALADAGLWPFSRWPFEADRLHGEGATCAVEADRLVATAGIELSGPWVVRIESAGAEADAWARLSLQSAASVGFRDLIDRLGIAVPDLVAADMLRQLAVNAVGIGADAGGTSSIWLELSGIARTTFLGRELRVSLERARLSSHGGSVAEAVGTLALDRLGSIRVTMGISGGLKFAAATSDLTVGKLVGAFGVALPPIPQMIPDALSPAAWKVSGLDFKLAGRRVAAAVDTGFGRAVVVVAAQGQDGLPAVAATFVPGANFRLASIVPALAPLDDLAVFDSPALLMASEPLDSGPAECGWHGRFDRGVQMRGRLRFEGGLAILRTLLATDGLPLRLPVDGTVVRIEATAGAPIEVASDVFWIDDFTASLQPDPWIADIGGAARLKVFGEEVGPLRLKAAFGMGRTSISMGPAEWPKPLGLPLDLKEIEFEVFSSGHATGYAMRGRTQLRKRTVNFAAQFLAGAPPVPVAISGEIGGQVGLADLLTEVLEAEVPGLPLLTVSNPTVHAVLDPRGADIAGRHYDRGVILGGDLDLVGLGATLRWRATPERAEGGGALKQAIDLGPVFSLRGKGGQGTPSIRFDTGGVEKLLVQAKLSVFGLEEEVDLVVRNEGLKAVIGRDFQLLRGGLDVTVGGEGLRGHGKVAFPLTVGIPLRVGNVDAGRLDVDVAVELDADVRVGADGEPSFTLFGSIRVAGQTVDLPHVKIKAATFAEMPAALGRHLIEEAQQRLGAFLDPRVWIEAFKAGVISQVANVAETLKQAFDPRDPVKLVERLATLGWGADRIFDALSVMPDKPYPFGGLQNIAGHLKAASHLLPESAVRDFAGRLWAMGKSPTDIVMLLGPQGLGVGPQVIAQAFEAFNNSSAVQLAQGLWDNGIRELGTMAKLLGWPDRFEAPIEDVAKALAKHFSPYQVVTALGDEFHIGDGTTLAQLLKGAGLNPQEAADALYRHGYQDLVRTLGNGFGLTESQVNVVLLAVGIPTLGGINQAWNDFTNEVRRHFP